MRLRLQLIQWRDVVDPDTIRVRYTLTCHQMKLVGQYVAVCGSNSVINRIDKLSHTWMSVLQFTLRQCCVDPGSIQESKRQQKDNKQVLILTFCYLLIFLWHHTNLTLLFNFIDTYDNMVNSSWLASLGTDLGNHRWAASYQKLI